MVYPSGEMALIAGSNRTVRNYGTWVTNETLARMRRVASKHHVTIICPSKPPGTATPPGGQHTWVRLDSPNTDLGPFWRDAGVGSTRQRGTNE